MSPKSPDARTCLRAGVWREKECFRGRAAGSRELEQSQPACSLGRSFVRLPPNCQILDPCRGRGKARAGDKDASVLLLLVFRLIFRDVELQRLFLLVFPQGKKSPIWSESQFNTLMTRELGRLCDHAHLNKILLLLLQIVKYFLLSNYFLCV